MADLVMDDNNQTIIGMTMNTIPEKTQRQLKAILSMNEHVYVLMRAGKIHEAMTGNQAIQFAIAHVLGISTDSVKIETAEILSEIEEFEAAAALTYGKKDK